MNKVLRKRILRDLKSNFARYFALMFLIVMGMYIVVSMVGSAESIISGTEQKAIENHTEDGEFTVFIPLTEKQEQIISEDGVTLEKMFSMDITLSDASMLRLMKNREHINLIDLDEGRLAQKQGEVVLEKRYAQVHAISVGDKITFAETEFSVTGIGSTADYDKPVAKFSDVSVKSEAFGLAFVTEEQYEIIKNSVNLKAEDYTYAYLLGETMTDASLKKIIQDFPFDYRDVKDPYFKEMLSDILSTKEEIQDNLNHFYDGTEEFSDGIDELNDNHTKLTDAANEIWDSALSSVADSLEPYGFHGVLTEENYESILDDY
ncbi:MAG: ABC transporter permease, partial [Oscillospiraceae bacterium]|nr:ABC transporter permease [Oscillospiraceae bacterium]